jgi:hypothetical protein
LGDFEGAPGTIGATPPVERSRTMAIRDEQTPAFDDPENDEITGLDPSAEELADTEADDGEEVDEEEVDEDSDEEDDLDDEDVIVEEKDYEETGTPIRGSV